MKNINKKLWLMDRFVIVYRNIRNQSQDGLLPDYPFAVPLNCSLCTVLSHKSVHEPLVSGGLE